MLRRKQKETKNTKYWRCYILWGYLTQKLQVNLSLSTVKPLRDQIKYNGDIERVIGSGRKRKLNSEQERFVVDWALENPLLTTVKLCERIHRKFEIEISHDTILRILTRYGFTWKVQSLLSKTLKLINKIDLLLEIETSI